METFKQFKGLIYLLIIAAVVIYLSEKFGKSETTTAGQDTATTRLLIQAERDKVSAEFWEREAQELGQQLNAILARETPIKQYYTGKKAEYSKKTANETDKLFLEVMR